MVYFMLHSALYLLDCPSLFLDFVDPLSSLLSIYFSHVPLLMSPVLECRHVLFGLNSDELRAVPQIFVYLLNVCKFFIWQSRNDCRFRGVQPGAASTIEKVKARVKFYLPLFFKRFRSSRRRRYFPRQWGARGVVASVAAGQLTFHL